MSKKNSGVVFAFDNEIKFHNGTLGALKLQITEEEWEILVKNTVEYTAYINCLKTVGMPILEETWEVKDEVYLKQLLRTIKHIKRLDSMILLKYDYDKYVEQYGTIMKDKAKILASEIAEFRSLSEEIIVNSKSVQVSGL